ncbi:F-box only protein 17 [Cricetulus griseus]|uniref:F-box only protein 17 n=2 Tax=Cricetulus griseus TaxID=10029 RepID=G3HJC4_CRIGR|nr:F-box only protein 17 [Cricetulus griseus]
MESKRGKESVRSSRNTGSETLENEEERAQRTCCRMTEETSGRLWVRLLDECENEVVKFSASPNPVLQRAESSCRQVSHVFTDFGKGIRYVSFEQYGRDTRSWVGRTMVPL